jgi:addiction module HigA family antidote
MTTNHPILTMSANLDHLTPGEILFEDYMKLMGLTQNALARALGVPPRRVNEIVHGKRAITLDTSLRLGRYFGQSPRFWLNVQTECDLRNAKQLMARVAREVHPMARAAA